MPRSVRERGSTLLGLLFFLAGLAILALIAVPNITAMVQTNADARLARESYRIDTAWKWHAAMANASTLLVEPGSLVLRVTAPSGALLTQRRFFLPAGVQAELRWCTVSGCSRTTDLSAGDCESLGPTGVPQVSADCPDPVRLGTAAPVLVLCHSGGCVYAPS